MKNIAQEYHSSIDKFRQDVKIAHLDLDIKLIEEKKPINNTI
ncbi:hypothetical protein [Pedobacter sp. UYP1]